MLIAPTSASLIKKPVGDKDKDILNIAVSRRENMLSDSRLSNITKFNLSLFRK